MSVIWFSSPLGRCEQTFIYLAKEMIYRLNKSFCLNLGRWTDDLIGDTRSITKWVTSVSAVWPRRPAWATAQECYTPGVSVNLRADLSESSISQKLFTAYVTLGVWPHESYHFLSFLSLGIWMSFLSLVNFHSFLSYMMLPLPPGSEHVSR